jgi:hypothetical protein
VAQCCECSSIGQCVWQQQQHVFWQQDVYIHGIMAQYARTLTTLHLWQVTPSAHILELICVLHIDRALYTAGIMTQQWVDSQTIA